MDTTERRYNPEGRETIRRLVEERVASYREIRGEANPEPPVAAKPGTDADVAPRQLVLSLLLSPDRATPGR